MDSILTLALIVVFVVLIYMTGNMKNELFNYKQEINWLREQNRELYNKTLFLYNILRDMGAVPGMKGRATKKTVSDNEQETSDTSQDTVLNETVTLEKEQIKSAPVQPELNVPVQQNVNIPVQNVPVQQNVNAPVQNAPVQQNVNVPVQNAPVQQNVNAPVQNVPVQQNVNAPVQNAPVQQNTFRAAQPVNTQPYINETVRRASSPVKQKIKNKHLEEWLGARLFNIAASLLIFIGLILFCTLSTDQVSNTAKMIAMFIVSGGFIAAGAIMSRNDRSIFPLGMLGTGFGTFFISILLSHVYFRSLGDIAAFSLILVWSAFALFMSKRLNSVMLSVTAHVGTAVSICFAYSLGFTAEKVVILTIYQIAAIAVIILGNIFCCRKTYRFGLIMSQGLLLYTSIAMSVAFSRKFIMPQSISAPAASVIYAIQFIAICFVSYLVSLSAAALEKENKRYTLLASIIHSVNKLLWTGGMLASVGYITYFICKHSIRTDAILPTTTAICIAAFLHVILTLILEEKLQFSELLSTVSLWFMSLTITFSLIAGAHATGLPFVFVYALLLVGIIRFTKFKSITPICAAVLLIEGVYMCFYGYFKAENVWVSIPYMFGMGVVLLLLWFIQDGKHKEHYFRYMKISEYLWISASIIPINASEFSDISIPLIISEFALMNIICYIIRFGCDNEPEIKTVVRAESLLTVYIGILSLAFEYSSSLGDNNIIKAVLVVMVGLITAVYMLDFTFSHSTFMQIAAALTVSAYFTCLAIGFQDHFKVFSIYAYTLDNKPAVFIFTLAILAIYFVRRNQKLIDAVWAGMLLDMVLMGFSGYSQLISFAYKSKVDLKLDPIPALIITTGFLLAHASILLGGSFLMGSITEGSEVSNNIQKKIQTYMSKFVSFIWINFSYPFITFLAFKYTKLDDYSVIFGMVVLTLINTAVFALKYQGEFNKPFNWMVRIVSSVAFYLSLSYFSVGKDESETTIGFIICVILMLSSTALFFAKSRYILKNDSSIIMQIYVGVNSTILLNAIVHATADNFNFTYIFTTVSMITALMCIIIGFTAKAKGLRIYGLVVVMLCIVKLVLIDISGADSLARVISFIAGGIICFIISGIYNKLEKKLSRSEQKPVLQPAYAAANSAETPAKAEAAQISDSDDAQSDVSESDSEPVSD